MDFNGCHAELKYPFPLLLEDSEVNLFLLVVADLIGQFADFPELDGQDASLMM